MQNTPTPVSTPELGTEQHRSSNDPFERLCIIHGPAMADQFRGLDLLKVKAEWKDALQQLDRVEIERGFQAARIARLPPNLPAFLRLCRPALDPEVAWVEAAEGLAATERGEAFAWSHRAVASGARSMPEELLHSTFKRHSKRWEFEMNRQWKRPSWPDPPAPRQPHPALLATTPVGPSPDVRARLSAIRHRLHAIQVNEGTST